MSYFLQDVSHIFLSSLSLSLSLCISQSHFSWYYIYTCFPFTTSAWKKVTSGKFSSLSIDIVATWQTSSKLCFPANPYCRHAAFSLNALDFLSRLRAYFLSFLSVNDLSLCTRKSESPSSDYKFRTSSGIQLTCKR